MKFNNSTRNSNSLCLCEFMTTKNKQFYFAFVKIWKRWQYWHPRERSLKWLKILLLTNVWMTHLKIIFLINRFIIKIPFLIADSFLNWKRWQYWHPRESNSRNLKGNCFITAWVALCDLSSIEFLSYCLTCFSDI